MVKRLHELDLPPIGNRHMSPGTCPQLPGRYGRLAEEGRQLCGSLDYRQSHLGDRVEGTCKSKRDAIQVETRCQ